MTFPGLKNGICIFKDLTRFSITLGTLSIKRTKKGRRASPLLPELHLLHDGLNVLNVVLLLPDWTLGLLQGPRLLAAHLLQHHGSLLTQGRQAGLCNESRRVGGGSDAH